MRNQNRTGENGTPKSGPGSFHELWSLFFVDTIVKNMLLHRLLIISISLPMAVKAASEVSITADAVPNRPRQFLIRWSASDCSDLYISNIGSVDAQIGTRMVEPEETTTYTMFARCGPTISQKSTTATVEGKKGIDWPENVDFSLYQHPITFDYDSAGYIILLKKIHQILQDDLHYSVSEIEKENRHVFLTLPSDLSGSQGYNPSIVWRIGFLVALEKPADGAAPVCELRARIQHRRRLEDTWRTDGDSNLHREQLEALRERLTTRQP